MAAAADFTIDELAQEVGLPSSTIRLYQNRGLLPAPRKEGRVAFYGADHVARIRLIGRLQERGFSLAAIGELVRSWEEGRSLDEVLGLERDVTELGSTGEIRMTVDELAARLPGVDLTPDAMTRVVELGFVEFDEHGKAVIQSPDLLEVGAALLDLGFPLDDVLDAASSLKALTDSVAVRFSRLFERHVRGPFTATGMPAERVAEVTATLDRLTPLADRVVQASLRRTLAAAGERLLTNETRARP